MRLYHGVGFIGRAVVRIEPNRCCGKSGSEVADRRIGRTARHGAGLRPIHQRSEVERALLLTVVSADKLRGGAGLLEGFSDYDSDGLMVVLDLRTTEQLGYVEVTLVELACIVGRDDDEHTGGGFGLAEVDALDPSLGDRRADDIAVGLVRRDVVPFIGVRRGAGNLERTVDAADGLPITLSWSIGLVVAAVSNFMMSALRLS
jgi:hypothetical protein